MSCLSAGSSLLVHSLPRSRWARQAFGFTIRLNLHAIETVPCTMQVDLLVIVPSNRLV